MELEIHHHDGGHAVALFGPVVIRVVTTAPTDLESVDLAQQMIEASLARWPMAGLWVVIHHGAPFPDSDFRRRVGPALRPYRDRLAMVASLLGLGFWAKTAVGVTSAMAKLVGHLPLIETTVEDGAARLGLELIGVDAEKLVASHDELLEGIQTSGQDSDQTFGKSA